MLSDIVALILAVTGVIFILFSIVFKLLVWRESDVILSIPLNSDDKEIYDRIINLWEICSFLGIQKQCTIAVVNYGASDNFINKLKNDFSEYDFLKIIYKDQPIKELHT
ncbi:MAG: hypothetical protein UGF89_05170 [Acutalibacteraceae bacterium]|nr:hypothetical protein [Acutalibacteraceae bacterium]